eukprot:c90_g1_i1.p1 GENE.c90_g1_i1~~c90_g1_i1.p1  ORF type:complete len:286 (-),score=68.88 c90_g1_i1:56-859(-)
MRVALLLVGVVLACAVFAQDAVNLQEPTSELMGLEATVDNMMNSNNNDNSDNNSNLMQSESSVSANGANPFAQYSVKIPPPSPAYVRMGRARDEHSMPVMQPFLPHNAAAVPGRYTPSFLDYITLGVMQSTFPPFKLPPTVSVPVMPGPAHVFAHAALNPVPQQLRDSSQVDAINAGAEVLESPNGFRPQNGRHPSFPAYGDYLKQWFRQWSNSRAIRFLPGSPPYMGNPPTNSPFLLPPGPLGSGVDIFAPLRAKMYPQQQRQQQP